MSIVRLVARPMLGALFVVQGAKQLRDPSGVTPRVQAFDEKYAGALRKVAPQIPDSPQTLARINAGVHVGAGLALATSTFPRVAATALAATMVPTTMAGHPFWAEEDEEARAQHKVQFLKNLGLFGGLLLAAVDTEGRPGLSWRARRAARDAKRSAVTARREAKLASRAAKAEVSARAHGATSRVRSLLPG